MNLKKVALAAGELEEYAALEAIGSLGAASTYSEGGAAVPNAVASAVAADSANGWKVLGAMGALVSCLPLGSASLEVGGGYRSVCLFVCLLFVRFCGFGGAFCLRAFCGPVCFPSQGWIQSYYSHAYE